MFEAVQFEFGIDSRPTGRATVAFQSHKDATDAMQFDKGTIGNMTSTIVTHCM